MKRLRSVRKHLGLTFKSWPHPGIACGCLLGGGWYLGAIWDAGTRGLEVGFLASTRIFQRSGGFIWYENSHSFVQNAPYGIPLKVVCISWCWCLVGPTTKSPGSQFLPPENRENGGSGCCCMTRERSPEIGKKFESWICILYWVETGLVQKRLETLTGCWSSFQLR
jgi:hypothetical protein